MPPGKISGLAGFLFVVFPSVMAWCDSVSLLPSKPLGCKSFKVRAVIDLDAECGWETDHEIQIHGNLIEVTVKAEATSSICFFILTSRSFEVDIPAVPFGSYTLEVWRAVTYFPFGPDKELIYENPLVLECDYGEVDTYQINFDLAQGAPLEDVNLTGQFREQGAIFSSTGPNGVIWHGTNSEGPFSQCMSAGSCEGGIVCIDPIRIDFVVPGTGIPAAASRVTIRGFDGDGDEETLVLKGFNTSGGEIASSQIGPSPFTSPGKSATVAGSQIAYVLIFPEGTESGLFFDDLDFQMDLTQPLLHFKRGDVNMDGKVEVTDVINFLNFQFVGSVPNLNCPDAADVDDNGNLDLSDAVRSLNYQFLGTADGPEPPGPSQCGLDVQDDDFPDCQYPGMSCR